jgi:hypothetical protein
VGSLAGLEVQAARVPVLVLQDASGGMLLAADGYSKACERAKRSDVVTRTVNAHLQRVACIVGSRPLIASEAAACECAHLPTLQHTLEDQQTHEDDGRLHN